MKTPSEAAVSNTAVDPAASAPADAPKAPWYQRLGAWYQRNRPVMTIILLVFLFLVALYSPDIFISIQPGQQGVLWSRFFGGTRLNYTMDEGLRLKFPWDKVWIYDVRLQQATGIFNALSADGLTLQVETTVRYRLRPRETPYLHKFVGPDYTNVLLLPEVAAHARKQISQYDPEALYTRQRDQIEEDTLQELRREVVLRLEGGVERRDVLFIEDFFFRSVVLPPQVDAAIQSKLAQRHLMLEYDYRIERERKEAARKTVEAQGIRNFQDIVAEGISDQYLEWKGIDATLALAQSENAKVVVIGSGSNGLPLILNLESGAATPAPGARSNAGARPNAGAGSIAPRPGAGPSSPPPASGAGSGSVEGAAGAGESSPPEDGVAPAARPDAEGFTPIAPPPTFSPDSANPASRTATTPTPPAGGGN